ncbi:MAG TPA: efflux RND transporter periplasmic adaptor subunit, partial [Povalibacter sp.]
NWLTVIITVAVITGALGYWIGRVVSDAPQPTARVESDANKERKILYWHDPMNPGAKFDQPGKSPFMDMDLVPVYADDVADSGVRINSSVVQNLGIRLGTVERADQAPGVEAVGNVVFDESLQEVVQARVAGNVIRLYVKAPLIGVRRGQPLLDVLAPEWLAAQQDYLALLDAPAAITSIRDAARQRLVVLGVPEPAIRKLEQERKATSTTTLVASVDGIVTELGVREGSTFTADTPLLRINGLKTVWANAQIPEGQVSLVSAKAGVSVRANAWPGEIFKGRLIGLLPDIDAQTRTLTARIAIDNRDGRLSPGMFVALSFTAPVMQSQLVVPSEAVIVTGERSVVIVKREDGTFAAVNVTVGAEGNGRSTILSGLTEGQPIVLSGQFLLDSEASLRSTIDRLGSSPEQAESPEAHQHP